MYVPSDDTFFLADCIRQYSGTWALEIGVGSGFLLRILEKNFAYIAASDIDLEALQHSKQQKKPSKALLVCCDAASAFGGVKFDLIVSNPPYLPEDDDEEEEDNKNNNNIDHSIRDLTVHGGPKGIETTIHFIHSALPLLARDGKMLFVTSSLADSSALDNVIQQEKLHKKVIREKRLFYETLYIVELNI
jgi:release factor glutamine methyltransferase